MVVHLLIAGRLHWAAAGAKLPGKRGRRLANVENIPQQDSAERAFNKLARTFASQVEALSPLMLPRRLRCGSATPTASILRRSLRGSS